MSYPGYQPYQQDAPGYPPPPSNMGYPPPSNMGYPPPPSNMGYPPPPSNMGYPGMPQPGVYQPPTDSCYPPPPLNTQPNYPYQHHQQPTQPYSPYPMGNYPPPPQSNNYTAPAPHHHQPQYPPANTTGGYPTSSYTTTSSYPPLHSQPHSSDAKYSNSYSSAAPHATTTTSSQSYKKGTPTLYPAPNFDPRRDAEILRKAMKGFGTDEKAIIEVLANRTNAQRQQIENQFKTLYGKDLIKDLKSELSGRFEDLVVKMMMPVAKFYAHEIHDAISGIGTDEDVLIEVLCTMSNAAIRAIKDAYHHKYNKSMEDELRSDTSGNFKRLLTSLCTANRDESFHVDPAQAQIDARALLQAGELRFGTDESTFNAILCSRNHAQLIMIFNEYYNITGHSIEKAIKREFSGDIEKGLLAIVSSVCDKAGFYAERLHNSMAGMGTKDRSLIRIIVTRSEIDMQEIKTAFFNKYGKHLSDFISGDTSGDYKKCLLALIKE